MGSSPNYIVMVVQESHADVSGEATGLREVWGGNDITRVTEHDNFSWL